MSASYPCSDRRFSLRADPAGHRSARRPVRPAAAGRLRPGDRLRRRSRRHGAALGRAGRNATCISSISTAPRQGQPVNGDSVRAIVQAAGVPCQLGGGLRTEDAHRRGAVAGASSRVILGTRALQDPGWCEAMCRRFPGQVVPGHRCPPGPRRHRGLAGQCPERRPSTWPARCAAWPLAAIVYTDISRDGMLKGRTSRRRPSWPRAVSVPVIASGGVDDARRRAPAGRAAAWPAASSAGPCTRDASIWRRRSRPSACRSQRSGVRISGRSSPLRPDSCRLTR